MAEAREYPTSFDLPQATPELEIRRGEEIERVYSRYGLVRRRWFERYTESQLDSLRDAFVMMWVIEWASKQGFTTTEYLREVAGAQMLLNAQKAGINTSF